MTCKRIPAVLASLAALASVALAPSARADGYIISSGGLARSCYMAARLGRATAESVDQCTASLANDPLDLRDRAGTFINRGTLRLHQKAWVLALADFDAAIALQPKIGEGHVNRAAALIGLARPAEAVAASDLGLSLNPSEPEKAYFNRAIADENLRDIQSAFADYTKASQLKPDWVAPKSELARFSTKAE